MDDCFLVDLDLGTRWVAAPRKIEAALMRYLAELA
jgi:hypothetical protein